MEDRSKWPCDEVGLPRYPYPGVLIARVFYTGPETVTLPGGDKAVAHPTYRIVLVGSVNGQRGKKRGFKWYAPAIDLKEGKTYLTESELIWAVGRILLDGVAGMITREEFAEIYPDPKRQKAIRASCKTTLRRLLETGLGEKEIALLGERLTAEENP